MTTLNYILIGLAILHSNDVFAQDTGYIIKRK